MRPRDKAIWRIVRTSEKILATPLAVTVVTGTFVFLVCVCPSGLLSVPSSRVGGGGEGGQRPGI